jgi:hypothetical protein
VRPCLSPHQPHVRTAVRQLLRVDDLETMPAVERDVALTLRLEVRRKTIGVAVVQDRGQDGRGRTSPLPVGMRAQTPEVPVRLGRMHFGHLNQSAKSTVGPLSRRLTERSGHRSDLFLGHLPGFRRCPDGCTDASLGRVDALVDHRCTKKAVEQQRRSPFEVVGRQHPGHQGVILKCPHEDVGDLWKIIEGGQASGRHRVKLFDSRCDVGLPQLASLLSNSGHILT